MFLDFDYNTQRQDIVLREYGRNVQKLSEYVKSIDDKPKRTTAAFTLVEMMKQINPAMKDSPEYNQKVWDDLYIISGFELDVDAPYDMPEKENIGRKPQPMSYHDDKMRMRNYGQNMEKLVQEAVAIEDQDERDAAVMHLAKMLRSFHMVWYKETADDDMIFRNLNELSGRKLKDSVERMREQGLPAMQNQGRRYNNGGGKGGRKNYSNQNKRRRN